MVVGSRPDGRPGRHQHGNASSCGAGRALWCSVAVPSMACTPKCGGRGRGRTALMPLSRSHPPLRGRGARAMKRPTRGRWRWLIRLVGFSLPRPTGRRVGVCVCVRTEDVGGELAEADVAPAARLAVVEDAGHEGVLVEGDGGHDGEQGEAHRPPGPAERVGERQHRRADDRRRQVEPRVPPRPCTTSESNPTSVGGRGGGSGIDRTGQSSLGRGRGGRGARLRAYPWTLARRRRRRRPLPPAWRRGWRRCRW
jgi:hypothetical protein